jgi:hypothetical protein
VQTARGAILIFLLLQITHNSRNIEEYYDSNAEAKTKVGVSNPWSEYIKFLPASVPLPTFYNEEERSLLYGTSLQEAVETKITSLEKEFENLRVKTESIPWCRQYWWDVETGRLTFEDWKVVDALYRSRALDLPGTGHAMVPCVDMANHASGEDTVALYETDERGNAVLQLRPTKGLKTGDEVTITCVIPISSFFARCNQQLKLTGHRYGDEKGASEMIFSYGFVEDTMKDARQLFLPLNVPGDDPLKLAKKAFCKDAPGVRLFAHAGKSARDEPTYWPLTGWESPFIWWSCVNEEDGLHFELLQTQQGDQELRASWKDTELGLSSSTELTSLKNMLEKDSLWDLFQLRATVMLQEKLFRQLSLLEDTEDVFLSDVHYDESGEQTGIRTEVYNTIKKLRNLETILLRSALWTLEQDVRCFLFH